MEPRQPSAFHGVADPAGGGSTVLRGQSTRSARTEPDGHWNIPDPVVLDRADAGIGRPFDWEFRSLPELCAARLPGMVLFGNSFSDLYWALGLQRYFCFIRRARDPISRFKSVL